MHGFTVVSSLTVVLMRSFILLSNSQYPCTMLGVLLLPLCHSPTLPLASSLLARTPPHSIFAVGANGYCHAGNELTRSAHTLSHQKSCLFRVVVPRFCSACQFSSVQPVDLLSLDLLNVCITSRCVFVLHAWAPRLALPVACAMAAAAYLPTLMESANKDASLLGVLCFSVFVLVCLVVILSLPATPPPLEPSRT